MDTKMKIWSINAGDQKGMYSHWRLSELVLKIRKRVDDWAAAYVAGKHRHFEWCTRYPIAGRHGLSST